MFFLTLADLGTNDAVDAVERIGLPSFLAIALIIVTVILIKTLVKMNEKQQESNSKLQEDLSERENDLAEREESVAKMFAQIMTVMSTVSNNTNPLHGAQEEEENRKINLLINTQLHKIAEKTGANRVSCFLFHNGGKDVTGRSFQKMSMTHEVVDANTISVMGSYQNIPRMMFPILVQKIADVGYYYIKDIEEIKTIDATTYQSFFARGAHAAYIRAIKSSDGLSLGFIAVEFISSNVTEEDKLKESLLNKATKISGALEIDTAPMINKGGECK